jgi:hypothetical protein
MKNNNYSNSLFIEWISINGLKNNFLWAKELFSNKLKLKYKIV